MSRPVRLLVLARLMFLGLGLGFPHRRGGSITSPGTFLDDMGGSGEFLDLHVNRWSERVFPPVNGPISTRFESATSMISAPVPMAPPITPDAHMATRPSILTRS